MERYNYPAQRDRDQCSSRKEGLRVLTTVMRRGFLRELAYATGPWRKEGSDSKSDKGSSKIYPEKPSCTKAWQKSKDSELNSEGCG